jgi:hypothetical protein
MRVEFSTALAIAATSLAAVPAAGGERLTVSELASRSQGALVAEVQLDTRMAPARITVTRVIWGVPDEIRPEPSWNGGCTGKVELLQHWIHRYPKWEARRLWRAALRERKYEAVLFIRPSRYTGRLEPYCETEAMLMEHTSLHPGYGDYLKRVGMALAERAAAGKPKK